MEQLPILLSGCPLTTLSHISGRAVHSTSLVQLPEEVFGTTNPPSQLLLLAPLYTFRGILRVVGKENKVLQCPAASGQGRERALDISTQAVGARKQCQA